MWKNDNMVEQKHEHVVFRENASLRSYTPHTKVGKKMCSDIIYLNLIHLMIYNQIQLKSMKNHVNVHNFDKKNDCENSTKTTRLS